MQNVSFIAPVGLPLSAIDLALRPRVPSFTGVSTTRTPGALIAHLGNSEDLDVLNLLLSQFASPLALTVSNNKTTIIANGTDSTTITCNDARITGDVAIEYYIDFNGEPDTTPTSAPTAAGQINLEFATDVEGVYRIRVQRVNGVEMGSVLITAGA